MLVAFLRDRLPLSKTPIGPSEIRNIDLDMVTIIGHVRFRCFAEHELLARPDGDARKRAACLRDDERWRAQDFAIEARDPFSTAHGHAKLDIRHAEDDGAEAGIGRMAMNAVSPGRDGLDIAVALAEIEAGAAKQRRHAIEPP